MQGQLYETLLSEGIVVRDRSSAPGCADCLRITVGTKEQNDKLLEILELHWKFINSLFLLSYKI